MGEKLLEQKLRDQIKKLGGLALKFSSMTFTGMPDRIVLMPRGRIYFVEMKSEGKRPTPRQAIVHEQLRGLGFDVWVIDNREALAQFLFAVELC